jgi:nucleotide-binding universal stress UspA family protein
LFQTLGFSGGLVVLLLVVGLAVTLAICLLAYKVAKWLFNPEDGWLKKACDRGLDRFCSFMDGSEARMDTVVAKLTKHGEDCDARHAPLGASNVKQLERAGHAAAEALRKIGRNETCDNETELIHAALNGQAIEFHSTKPLRAGEGIVPQPS